MTDDRQLVAFLTTKSKLRRAKSQTIASKLHTKLSKTLNKYMIPAYYQFKAAFPMTVSGKINRVGLNSMTLDPVFHIKTISGHTQRREELIESQASGPLDTIKSLFSKVLKLPGEKVVIDTNNFFKLGGQSVLALRLQKALKNDLSVKVKLVDIFRNPTPAGLVKRFDLFSAFTEHQMFDDRVTQMDLLTRAEIVQGAMGKEKFGLANDEFVKLGRSVDAIYHTGGFVSLLATYGELRPRNVQSVFDMIELASHGCGPTPTALHYISTWSIVHVQTWSSTSLSQDSVWLDEQSVASFRPPATNDHGYFKTRWVSEMLMEAAGKRGFPTTIYRCPAHTAPTAAQCATPGDNFTINMCVRMAETGLVLQTPARRDSLESDMGMIPIDYLADTLVRLADVEEVATAAGEALRLHITNPSPLAYSKVPDLVAQLHGGSVAGKMLNVDEWFEAITAVSDEKVNLELAMYKEYLDKGHIMFAIDDRRTRPLLHKIASQAGRVECDAADFVYFQNLWRQEKGRR